MHHADIRCAEISERQHGILSYQQAQRAGMGKKSMYRRVHSGLWRPIHPRVYLIGGAPLTWKGSLMAASLWAGPKAAVSHRAAACLHGFERFVKPVLEITSTRRLAGEHSLKAHRCSELPMDRVVDIDGLPVTDVERTLLDLAAVARRWDVEAALDAAIRKGQTDLDRVVDLFKEEERQGRGGRKVMGELLADRGGGQPIRDSDLHREFVRFLQRGGVSGFKEYFPVGDEVGFFAEIDVAFPGHHLGFEVDGYSAHSSKEAFDTDRKRERKLTLLGWTIVRVTKKDLRDPDGLLRDVRGLLRKSGTLKRV